MLLTKLIYLKYKIRTLHSNLGTWDKFLIHHFNETVRLAVDTGCLNGQPLMTLSRNDGLQVTTVVWV